MWENARMLEASIEAMTATAALALRQDFGRQLPQATDVKIALIAAVIDMPAFSNVRIHTCAAAPRVGFKHPRAGDFTHPFEPSTGLQSTLSPSLRRP